MMKRIAKSPTGIEGFDEITNGGLPTGRPTLVCGSAGAGKTLLALEFLVRGILKFGEPGVFFAFEETERDLAENCASLGYDLEQMQRDGLLAIDHVAVDPDAFKETGEYDLEGLFIRLRGAVESVKAKRVVLDTLEVLFGGVSDQGVIRAELRRLFDWIKDNGLTAIVTAERGEGALTRHGLEEYVADCVIVLDHRIADQISTRRLRDAKYRGTLHGADEYPFLMDEEGITVLPITSIGLNHTASSDSVSSGVPGLDAMLARGGFFRGSSILVSGTAGTGKSSLAASFVKAACDRGESALYLSFEESTSQIVRNMRSVGIDLWPAIESGRLRFSNIRPTGLGLEQHLASIHKAIKAIGPQVIVMDPLTNFLTVSNASSVKSMLTRLIDFLKIKQITALFTSLSSAGAGAGAALENTSENVSSIMDAWIQLRDVEHDGRRSGALFVLKSRGMPHSREMKEFLLTDSGIRLGDVYTERFQGVRCPLPLAGRMDGTHG